MLQMTLYLTRSSRLWTLLVLGLEVCTSTQKKEAILTVSMEIHKGTIFDPFHHINSSSSQHLLPLKIPLPRKIINQMF
jgi:hypothetical protein